jgi:hypothetical protein
VLLAGKALGITQSVGLALEEGFFESDRAPVALFGHPAEKAVIPPGCAVHSKHKRPLRKNIAYGTASFPAHWAPSGHSKHSCDRANVKCGF